MGRESYDSFYYYGYGNVVIGIKKPSIYRWLFSTGFIPNPIAVRLGYLIADVS